MPHSLRLAVLPGIALLCIAPIASQAQYQQTNLISDIQGLAQVYDPNLVNPWGIAMSGTSPFWISDNGTDVSTLYSVKPHPGNPSHDDVTIVPLVVSIPGGAPTGQIFNGNGSAFKGDRFIFDSEAGAIVGWQGGTAGTVRANSVLPDGIYKGLALANNQLYATDFHNGRVDVFGTDYKPVTLGGSAFVDPTLPSGYAPYNIQNIGGKLYVAFAQQDADAHDANIGAGLGFVDVFDANGNLLKRIQHGDWFNQPWGVAVAPSTFGQYANDLLVGNFGDGRINAFDPTTGDYLGFLADRDGVAFSEPGLWGLTFGNGGSGGDPNKLYFTSGINDENNGLFGSLQAVPEPGAVATFVLGSFSTVGFLLRRRRKS